MNLRACAGKNPRNGTSHGGAGGGDIAREGTKAQPAHDLESYSAQKQAISRMKNAPDANLMQSKRQKPGNRNQEFTKGKRKNAIT